VGAVTDTIKASHNTYFAPSIGMIKYSYRHLGKQCEKIKRQSSFSLQLSPSNTVFYTLTDQTYSNVTGSYTCLFKHYTFCG